MSQDRLRGFERAEYRLVRHILNKNCRNAWACLGIWLVDESRAATSSAKVGHAAIGRSDGRVVGGDGTVVQLGESLGKVISMNLLVGRILEAHLPTVGRAGRGRDEEQLASVGQLQMFWLGLDGRVVAKVELDALTHDSFAVPHLSHR